MGKRILSLLLTALLFACCGCAKPAPPAATSFPPESAQPEPFTPVPTDVPGVWLPDDSIGVAVNKDHPAYAVPPHQTHSYAEGEYAQYQALQKQTRKTIGGWTYYLDIESPIEYTGEYAGTYAINFPVCRKNGDGKVEFLNIYGLYLQASNQYLYVGSMMLSGTDFVSPETYRVSLDGQRIEYVGFLWNFTQAGSALYFADASGMNPLLYRTSDEFGHVERLRLAIPDLDEILKKAEISPDSSFYEIQLGKIDSAWIRFTLTVLDRDYNVRYTGGYKIRLAGGAALKTDKGKYDAPDPENDIE